MAFSIGESTPRWNRQYPAAFSGENGKKAWDFFVGTPSEVQASRAAPAPPSVAPPVQTIASPAPAPKPTPVRQTIGGPTSYPPDPQSETFQRQQEIQEAIRRGQELQKDLPRLDAQGAAKRTGGTVLDVMPQGVNPGQRVTAMPATAMETGGFKTDYSIYGQDGKQGTMSITGPNQRVGGGTLSVLSGIDPEQRAATAQTVAGINSQIDALRSLREARNPGVTTGGMAAGGIGAMPSFNPFDRPGDGYGDRQMRQNRYDSMIEEATSGQGLTRRQRGALIDGAQGLLAPGLAAMQQQGVFAQNQATQQAGLLRGLMDAQGNAARLTADQDWRNRQLALDERKLGIDQQTNVLRLAATQDWRNQQLALKREAPQAAGRPLSMSAASKLQGMAQTADAWNNLNGSFQDQYGGYKFSAVGTAANWAKRTFGDNSGQAQWWQSYDAQANQVRHELFGSALTATEKEAFNKAMINPGMNPQQVRENLARQSQIAAIGMERLARSMAASGYSQSAINEATGGVLGSSQSPMMPNAGIAAPSASAAQINQLGAAWMAQGMSEEQVLARLRQGGYRVN